MILRSRAAPRGRGARGAARGGAPTAPPAYTEADTGRAFLWRNPEVARVLRDFDEAIRAHHNNAVLLQNGLEWNTIIIKEKEV